MVRILCSGVILLLFVLVWLIANKYHTLQQNNLKTHTIMNKSLGTVYGTACLRHLQ